MATAFGTRDGGEIAVAFSRILRGAGVDVPTSSTIAFTEALAATGLTDRDTTYWAGRATLVRRPEDHELYDRAFRVFWDHASATVELVLDEEPPQVTLAIDDDDADQDDAGPDQAQASDDPVIELRFSATEVLRQKDFADYTPDELVEAQQLMTLTQEPDIKATLIANTEAAVERGLFGVPTIFIGEQMFFGQDRMQFVEQALQG